MNKRKSLLITLGVCFVVVVVCLMLPDQVTQPMRKQVLQFLGPLLVAGAKPASYLSEVNGKLRTLDEAQAEVTRLRARMAELTIRNQLLLDRSSENARLREMLGYKQASKYFLLPCHVISREPSSWWDSVQVDVGDAENDALYRKYKGKFTLTPDEPVISPRGVVGKTGTVSQNVTEVILLVNENCSISAKLEIDDATKAAAAAAGKTPPEEHGIVQGQGNFEEGKPRVKVKYLPKNSQVAVGQFIVTSGLGPYFPPGLRLGTVVEVPALKNEYPTFGLYREAVIEPTANLDQLDELFIVLSSNPENRSEDKPDPSPPVETATPDGPR